MLAQHETEIRVRYSETDAMGYLHHCQYFNYFEVGRVELFRSHGGSYREVEESGSFLVVVKISCQYKAPARYDDLLRLRTTIVRMTSARIDHRYEVFRDGLLIAEGESVLACVDRNGRAQRLPEAIKLPPTA